MAVAEQMGERLRATAHSVNIKERLDFSCAIFDAEGNLIANAPHIPVHLGSMSESIKMVIGRNEGHIRPGDVYALNDPYHGGTHLPDVTVVTPVFAPDTEDKRPEVWFYVASRGHHAEIGGVTPGSMPASSTRIEEEGVLIDNWLLVDQGRLRETETLELLTKAAYPSRDPRTNLADLRAQIAANAKGAQELHRMAAQYGLDVVRGYMGHVRENAAEAVRNVITALHRDGAFRYELDNEAVIQVKVTVDKQARTAVIDFTGTSGTLSSNFNAPSSVAMAAVLYVFRTLVDKDIPLNAGCLEPLTVIIPAKTMLSPEYPAAVAAGNVETSQAVTGALYAALNSMAEGSGTMNNVTFGNERHQYYETVASGSGAGDGFDGTGVVQTKMTNSRLTDPEVLEWRYPVRLRVLRDPPRQRRRRPLARRRRRHQADPLPRAGDRHHAGQPPPGPRLRPQRRRRGRTRQALGGASGRHGHPDGRLRQRGPRRGRRVRDRDSRRRRLRTTVVPRARLADPAHDPASRGPRTSRPHRVRLP